MKWIFVLLSLSWVAIFTSQSLVDFSDLLVVVTALVLAFKKQEWKNLFRNFRPTWLWPVWLGVLLIGLILNADLRSPEPWKDFFEFRWILTLLSWIYILKNLWDHKKAFSLLGVLTLILNVAAFGVWLKNPTERAGGLLGSIMSFAHNITPIFCLYFILTLTNWKNLSLKLKSLYLAVLITSFILVVVTFTRGVWIGSLVALSITTFIWNKKLFGGVLAGFLIVFLLGITTSERFANRVFTRTNLETDSNQERTALWRGNWAMIKDYPVFGVGIGQNKSHLRDYYDMFGYPQTQRQSHAHNQYLQYWAGTGTLGFICFLIFLFVVLKYSYQSYKDNQTSYLSHLQLGLLAAMICFLVGSLTESNFNIAKNRFLFLMLAGMAVAWSNNKKDLPEN